MRNIIFEVKWIQLSSPLHASVISSTRCACRVSPRIWRKHLYASGGFLHSISTSFPTCSKMVGWELINCRSLSLTCPASKSKSMRLSTRRIESTNVERTRFRSRTCAASSTDSAGSAGLSICMTYFDGLQVHYTYIHSYNVRWYIYW